MDLPKTRAFQGPGKPLLYTKVDSENLDFIVMSIGGICAGQLYLGGDRRLLANVAEGGNLILWNMKDGWPSRNVAAHVAKSPTRYTRRTGVLALRRPFGGSGSSA
jgi:hypothetical protein